MTTNTASASRAVLTYAAALDAWRQQVRAVYASHSGTPPLSALTALIQSMPTPTNRSNTP